jgi:hypothetical protein
MPPPLRCNPNPKRLVLLVALWHHAMAILLFKLDQLFTLLVPALAVWFAATDIFPSKPNFVQKSLSMKSNCVVVINGPLRAHPLPKRFVLLVASWRHAMAILCSKLDQLFALHVPSLVMLRHSSQGTFLPSDEHVASIHDQVV